MKRTRRFPGIAGSVLGIALTLLQTPAPSPATEISLTCPVVNVLDRQGHVGKPLLVPIRVDAAKHILIAEDGEAPNVTFGASVVSWREPAAGGTATFSYALNLATLVMHSAEEYDGGTKPWTVKSSGRCARTRPP